MRNTGRVFVPNIPGPVRGTGPWDGGGKSSLFKSIASQLGAVAAYDAGFGRVLSGSSVTALADLTGHGYIMAQTGALTLCPTYGVDSRGPYLAFDGGDHLFCDALGVAFAGTSVPFWVLAAIDGMTRGATQQILFMMASASAPQFAYSAPNTNTTTFGGYRTDAEGGDTTTVGTNAATEGVVADLYDGATRTITFGSVTSIPRTQGGVLTTGRASIGAARYGAGPTITLGLVAKLRGLIVGTTITPAALAAAAATLKARYGY